VTFVTGNLKKGELKLNWDALAKPNQTIVFYMGLHGIQTICKELVAHGVPDTMPAALVQQGTTPNHQVYIGNLRNLPSLVEEAEVKPPTLIIVGRVVELHEKLNWYKPVNLEES
jgi:uroporphyrin-III C-methyltransferase/precorrin-2 dehydrogenase/sirohydrochlorin ferrochelatase